MPMFLLPVLNSSAGLKFLSIGPDPIILFLSMTLCGELYGFLMKTDHVHWVLI
jgi:hypothetical protein